jgi:predicted nucleic acid-binding protein
MAVTNAMLETIFWDTAAFVALGNRDDALHEAAVAVSQELAREEALVLTTDAVLTEVVNTFSKAAWRPMAKRLIEVLQQSVEVSVAQVVHVNETLWQRGWQLFLERPDKDWGLTDCISFVVMQEHGLTRAFTSDRHFEQAGFVRLMGA